MSRYSPILTSGGSKVRRVHDVAGEMEIVICYRGVGKTRLRMRYVQDEFKSDWQESTWRITDETTAIRTTEGRTVKLNVMEATGNEEYDRLRPLMYPITDIVIFCFAVNDIDSFERLRTKLIDEVCNYFTFGVPMVLLGLKSDLRQNEDSSDKFKFVTPTMIRDLAKEKGIKTTDACSALNGDNVENISRTSSLSTLKVWKEFVLVEYTAAGVMVRVL